MTLKVQILQTLRRLLIILKGLNYLVKKRLISIYLCRHGLMPNLITKSWTVSMGDRLMSAEVFVVISFHNETLAEIWCLVLSF